MVALTMYAHGLRPLLFLLPAHTAHALAFAGMGPLEHVRPLRAAVRTALRVPTDARLTVHALGLEFPSPVGLAAGFDKDARRPRALAALGFGHIELGTVTAVAQAANPLPNLFRLPGDRALVNRLGFPNQGAELVARRLRAAKPSVSVPVGVSIGKSRVVPADDLEAVVKDYAASFDQLRDVADFVVVNVSSPNTAGLRAMQGREHAMVLLSALTQRAGRSDRLLVKIAPDLDDAQLEDVLSVVEAVGLGGVVATNTTTSREGLATDAQRVAAVGAGGLSGAPLRARSLAMVRRIRARLGRRVAVFGVGGIERADHAMAMIRAGADLVQLYTGFIYEGPAVAARMARELLRMVEREGVGGIAELVGVAG